MPKHVKRKKPWPVFLAIILGITCGSLTGKDLTFWHISFFSIYDILGKLFLNSLTLIVVPLVTASIISGVAKIGGESNFGRLGIKMFVFYLGTNLCGILVGVSIANLFHPGAGLGEMADKLLDASKLAELKSYLGVTDGNLFTNLLLQVIPSNVFDALAKGNMLGLIFFSLLFGYTITKIQPSFSTTLLNFWSGIFEAMLKVTQIVLRFLPLGVFGLVAKVFAETGIESLASVGLFFVSVLLGLGFFVFILLPALLKFIGKVSPWKHFKAVGPALITAFSTSSSAASLPVTLECMEKRAGVSNRICSLVIPLGTSVNLSGSALYEGLAALFIAQAFGLHLSFITQLMLVFVTLIASIGVAGIPGGSLVAILIILKGFGLPPEGIGLFLAVDRILDMFRTTTNVFSDTCCAILIAKSEGEKGILSSKEFSE